MVGVTLSTTLTGVLLEVPYLWRRGTLATVAVALTLRGVICMGLSGLSALPFVVGAHAAARTGRVRLLFGVCLVLFSSPTSGPACRTRRARRAPSSR